MNDVPMVLQRVQDAFRKVRKEFHLGVGELQAAIDAVQGGFGLVDSDALEQVLKSLWCHSVPEQMVWEKLWREMVVAWEKQKEDFKDDRSQSDDKEDKTETDRGSEKQSEQKTSPKPQGRSVETPVTAGFSALPVQVPNLAAAMDEFELRGMGPVTRRSMSYGWRSMRRLRADGPRDVVDVRLTVVRVAKTGIYVGPVMGHRRVNHMRLVLLIDQQGSMVPFHRLSRDLVETAREDANLERFDVFYFYNVPQEFLYRDEHLTEPIALAEVLGVIDDETSVVMVSDAGAARGRREKERILATMRFLRGVRSRTAAVGWLNPMPRERWNRSSAEILAEVLPMSVMDRDGFGQMVEKLMGQLF